MDFDFQGWKNALSRHSARTHAVCNANAFDPRIPDHSSGVGTEYGVLLTGAVPDAMCMFYLPLPFLYWKT